MAGIYGFSDMANPCPDLKMKMRTRYESELRSLQQRDTAC